MAIALHPYIMGQPHRIGYLEQAYADITSRKGVVHMNGAEILNWYSAARETLSRASSFMTEAVVV